MAEIVEVGHLKLELPVSCRCKIGSVSGQISCVT